MRFLKLTHNASKVVIFAIAFAFVEASVAVYLRQLLGATRPTVDKDDILLLLPGIAFLEPNRALKIISNSSYLAIEKVREAATIIMLLTLAWLSARKIKDILAYFCLAFGVWDLFYYVFLKLTINWPKTWGDYDVFFLLPVPWIGPVLAPIAISLVLIISSLFYLSEKK